MPKQKQKSFKTSIPPHKHCPICGRSMPVDMDYCSNKCRAEALKRQRSERRNMMLMMGLMFGMMALLFIMMMLERG